LEREKGCSAQWRAIYNIMKKKNLIPELLLFSTVSLIYAYPILENISYWGQMDWDQFTYWNAVPREIMLNFHQFPLWTPYTNGGNVLLAHPQSPFLSPFYIFVMVFGPILGLKIEIIVHLFIGLLGMYHLANHLKLSRNAAYLSSFVFMLSSLYVLHLTEGHTEWLAMAFIPWVFLYFLKSLNNSRRMLGAVFFLALILLNGSIDVFAIFVFFISVYALLKAFQLRRVIPLQILSFIFLGTFLLCAVKLIPMLEFLHQNPRLTDELSGTKFSVLTTMLLGRNQAFLDVHYLSWMEISKMGLDEQWHEYGAYIGIIPLLLFFCGAITRWKEYWPLILTGLISLLIALGEKSPVNVWGVLHTFPIYNSLTTPSRFILGFVFSAALLSGFGLSAMERLISKIKNKNRIDWAHGLSLLIVFFVVCDLWVVNSPIFKNAFRIRPVKITTNETFQQRFNDFNFHKKERFNSHEYDTSYSSMYPIFLSNSGILEAYEVVNVIKGNVRSISDSGYRGEAYLHNSHGGVFMKYFSPNKIIVEAHVKSPDTLILNQNYYNGWKVKIDDKLRSAESYRGLIATRVQAGNHKVIFYYAPLSFLIGLLVSVSFILTVAIYYLKRINFNTPGKTE